MRRAMLTERTEPLLPELADALEDLPPEFRHAAERAACGFLVRKIIYYISGE